jgi:uncharacterized protein YbbK (DUF523 family)
MDHFSSAPSKRALIGFYHPLSESARPRVAVSACLAGERVRYDGADRHLPAIALLAERVQLVPVCPEVGAGLGVPRPPVQLVSESATAAPRALGRDDPTLDVTSALANFARASLADRGLTAELCGYLLKSRSPSCGSGSTPLFDRNGEEIGSTSGIQAAYFRSRLPWLSYCEETALVDDLSIKAFELRCRIVFDWLHAGDTPIDELLRHYRQRLESLAPDIPADADRTTCLAALQATCAALPPLRLLEMFSD